MNWQPHVLILADELHPAVHCGQRDVEAQVGHKWVRVRPRFTPGYAKRIRRSEWDALLARTARRIERGINPNYIKRRK